MNIIFTMMASCLLLFSSMAEAKILGYRISNHIYQKDTGKNGKVACVPSSTAMATEVLLKNHNVNRNQADFLRMSNREKVQYLGQRMGTNKNGTSTSLANYKKGIAQISSGIQVGEISNLKLNKSKMNDIIKKEIKRQPSSFAVNYDYYYELRVEMGLIKFYKPMKVKDLGHVVAVSAHVDGSYYEYDEQTKRLTYEKKKGFLVNDPLMKSKGSQHGAKFSAPRFGTYCAKKVFGICYRWKHRSKPSKVAGLTIGNKDNCSGYGGLCKVANLFGEEVHYVTNVTKFQLAPSAEYTKNLVQSSSKGGYATNRQDHSQRQNNRRHP